MSSVFESIQSGVASVAAGVSDATGKVVGAVSGSVNPSPASTPRGDVEQQVPPPAADVPDPLKDIAAKAQEVYGVATAWSDTHVKPRLSIATEKTLVETRKMKDEGAFHQAICFRSRPLLSTTHAQFKVLELTMRTMVNAAT